MGLEGVELLMEVEDAFGISIPDEDATRIQTAGELHAYVLDKLGKTEIVPPKVCGTSRTFYRLRKAMVDLFGVPRDRIRPDTPVRNILPKKGRKDRWKQLAEVSGLTLPGLWQALLPLPAVPPSPSRAQFLPTWLKALLYPLAAASITLSAVVLMVEIVARGGVLPCALLAILVCVVLTILWFALVKAARTAFQGFLQWFPIPCNTVGGLARRAAVYDPMIPRQADGTPAEVWRKLVGMIAETYFVEPERIRPESRFVDDLMGG